MNAQAEGQFSAQFAPADEGKSELQTDLGRPTRGTYARSQGTCVPATWCSCA